MLLSLQYANRLVHESRNVPLHSWTVTRQMAAKWESCYFIFLLAECFMRPIHFRLWPSNRSWTSDNRPLHLQLTVISSSSSSSSTASIQKKKETTKKKFTSFKFQQMMRRFSPGVDFYSFSFLMVLVLGLGQRVKTSKEMKRMKKCARRKEGKHAEHERVNL